MKWLRAWPAWMALAHAVIGVLFGAVVPPWEGYDETGHFAYVSRLADGRGLPNRDAQRNAILDQSHQPPLYYVLASLPAMLVDRSDNVSPQINVFATDGTNRHGVRQFVRTPEEAWPWRGTVLALHLARMISTLLGALNVLLIALLAIRVLGDGGTAKFAAALAAFNPQALFMGALVNNDVLVNLAGTAVAIALAVVWHKPGVRGAIALGALMGLSMWAKRTGLSVILAAGFAIAAMALIRRWSFGTLVRIGLAAGATCALVVVPLLASNWSRFGVLIPDRESVNKIVSDPGIAGSGVATAWRDGWLLKMFDNAFRTFWGGFGWGNVKLPEFAYLALYALCAVALFGLLLAVWRRKASTTVWLLAFVGGIALLPTVRALGYHDQSLLVGRYLLPAMGPIACLIALGWGEVVGRWPVAGGRWPVAGGRWQTAGVVALGGVAAAAVPLLQLRPLYAGHATCEPPGTTLLQFENTAIVNSVAAEYFEEPDLALGTKLPFVRVRLGWNVFATPEQLAAGVSVLGRNGEVLGTENKYPQGGNLPSTIWRTCDTFFDEYLVELRKKDASLPARGRVSVSLFVPGQPITRTLAVVDSHGRPGAPIIGEFRVPAYVAPQVDATKLAPSGSAIPLGNIRIVGQKVDGASLRADGSLIAAPGTRLTVDLTYLSQGNNPRAIGFVHLLDSTGRLVAQDDHPPAAGDFPVDFWLQGDAHIERYQLTIPANAQYPLRLVTGMYAESTQQRFETGATDNLIELARLVPAN